MPRRTNIYQRLIAEIYRGLGPGWTVLESAMLPDRRTGEPREIDVLISAVVAGHPINIAIECRDHRRAAPVTWVEAMAARYDDLPVDKLILYSASGFTKSARVKAAQLGIEAVATAGIESVPWAKWAREVVGGSLKYVVPNFDPAVDVVDEEGRRYRSQVTAFTQLRRRSDGKVVSMLNILDQIRKHPQLRETLLDHAPEGSGDFHYIYTLGVPCEVLEGDRTLGDFDRLVVGIRTHATSGPPETRSILLKGQAHTLASLSLSEGELTVLISQAKDQSEVVRASRHRR